MRYILLILFSSCRRFLCMFFNIIIDVLHVEIYINLIENTPYLNQQNTPWSIFNMVYLYRSKNPHKIGFERYFITRDAFLAAKLRKEGFWELFTVRTKSHLSNFEVGWPTFPWSRGCLSLVFNTQIITGSSELKKRVFLGKCTKWNSNFQNFSKALCLGSSEYSI